MLLAAGGRSPADPVATVDRAGSGTSFVHTGRAAKRHAARDTRRVTTIGTMVAGPVGIVVVSHSDRLAAGLCELLSQFAGRVPVEAAGGTDDGGLGVSEVLIRAAIARADRGAGVAVLADLGSAVLTVRDVLTESPRTDVTFADAPLVEGAVAATVIAGTGADLPGVIAAAEETRDTRKLA